MNYVLKLAEDSRIQYASEILPHGNYYGMPIVEALPEGDISDYLYVDGQYVFDPPPEPEQPEPEATTDDVLNALLGVTE